MSDRRKSGDGSDRRKSGEKLDGLLGRLESLLPARIRRSYAAKFWLGLLVVMVLIAGFGAYIHFDTQSQVTAQTESEVSGIAKVEAKSVNDWVVSKRSTTTFVAESIATTDGSGGGFQERLDATLIDLPQDVQGLHYVNPDTNIVVASTNDDLTGQELSSEEAPWVEDLNSSTTDSVGVSAPHESVGGSVPVVGFTTRVAGLDGVLVLTASLPDRSKEFHSPIPTGDIKVVDSDGTVVLDNRNADLLEQYGGDDGSSTVVERGLDGDSGVRESSARVGMDEGDYVVAYRPILGTDWVMTYHVPVGEAYALQNQVTTNIWLLAGASVVALLFIGLTIGRVTANSLDVLAGKADAIADGRLDVEVPESSREDELGRLFGAFGEMRDYLDTAADQAEALANEEFDADVLDEDVPGTFGTAFDRMHTNLESLIRDIETARDEAEDAREDAEALTAALERKATEFGDVMSHAAEGDLTARMDTDSESDAMNDIAGEFNAMMEDLADTVAEVHEFADTVTAASREVTHSAAEISTASEEVSEATQVLSEGAGEQKESLTAATNELSQLSASIQEVAASAEEVARTAQRTNERSESGREAAEEAREKMAAVSEEAEETVSEIHALAEEMDEIGEIVDLIGDIADQTNVLALNASIEAASADASGDGFAVVAEEVKSLATETKEAADEVEARIERIRERTERAVEDISDTREEVAEGERVVSRAHDALETIADNVDETTEGVQEISRATDEQAVTTEEVVATMDEATDISERSARKAEDAAAASEQQTATVAEVSDSADRLAQRADDLLDLLDEFEIESDPAEARADD
ncbi:methyl-accepting chemotaxis protein [Halorussus salilacus]|uniref:methyl-accepting chemotaxis protein n=1 Tax=Halorussus salilacus TaxID=2953750 RepID=UPI0020A1A398|nr:methyl-accepting chemotaxis protein [Halorussus salilacus]USZ68392.1 methyl-accepting chemotaxis protein [Halorussus salilacus]